MTYSIEVLILPVSDVDRARAFYTEKAGFTLDVDYQPADDFRDVQLTPPDRADHATFADFTDPDGNLWVLQERGFRDQPVSAGA
jgi:hypothetical protein